MSPPALPAARERSARAEERRRAILDAALRVIARGGPDAVTHRRVAAEAGVPLGSTTYYFASRADLLRQAFRHYLAEVASSLEELEREFPPDDPASVVRFFVEMARREFMNPDMVRAEYELILYAARDAALAAELNAWERRLESRLAGVLERHGARSPADAARTVVEMIRGFELARLTRPERCFEALARRLATVVSALTDGRRRPERHGAPPARLARRGGS